MSQIKTCVKNILESGTVSLSAGTADSSYPLYRLYDRDIGKIFKITAAATLEVKIEQPANLFTSNPDFETGNFTGWTQGSSAIDSGDKHRGTYSSKITASGSTVNGCYRDYEIDPNKIYRIITYAKCGTYTAGNYKIQFRQMDEDLVSLGLQLLHDITVAGNWIRAEKTIGPSGSGCDYTFASGCKFIRIKQYTDTTPTLTGYLDDVFLFENSNYLSIDQLFISSGHNLNGMTIDLKYSDDDITYTEALTQFYGYPGLIQKSFTAQQRQFWKFIITTPAVIPEIPELFLSPSYEWTLPDILPIAPSGNLNPEFNVEHRQSASGADRFLIYGDSKRQRIYPLVKCNETQKTNILSFNDSWQGAKPFYLYDHEGTWIYGMLIAPIDLQMYISTPFYQFNFNFREVIPG